MAPMHRVVRLGPLPLMQRPAGRLVELERIVGEAVDLIEMLSVADLAAVVGDGGLVAVVLDATLPDDLADGVQAAGSLPVLRPIWRRQRNARGETDEVFDGYGRLLDRQIVMLADGELSGG